MFLEFNYSGGLFYVKMPNSQKIFFWRVPAHSWPDILGPTPKFKIPLPRLFSLGPKVSKKVCHTPVGQKLREEIDFLETGHFQPRAVRLRLADLTPPPKNYLYRIRMDLKILSISLYSIKSYSTFSEGLTDRHTHRQTHRQTHKPPSIYRWANFFMPVLDTFHFTTFASLTALVKDN